MAPSQPPDTRWSALRSAHYFRMLISSAALVAAVWLLSTSTDAGMRESCFALIGLILGYWLR